MPKSDHESLINIVTNVARAHCKSAFDPAVILAVFQFLRTNAQGRRIYLASVGGTGMERGSRAKHIVNPLVGRMVAAAVKAIKTGEEVEVQGEFVETYSVLKAA